MSEKRGIINVLKPPGMTSMQVVTYIKKILPAKKAGHTGTLDPLAAGVLPICTGRATKVIPYLNEDIKIYRGELILGQETDTHDREGEVVHESDDWQNINQQKLSLVCKRFTGKIKQVPPMFSAVHHNGKRLYELAREGKNVKREAREIEIFSLKIVNFALPRVKFRVICSRGTYIRSLVRDIGRELNTGAFLSFLLRIRSGPFRLKESYIPEKIYTLVNADNFSFLKSPAYPLPYPHAIIKNSAYKKAVNGGFLYLDDLKHYPENLEPGEMVLVFDKDDNFISINSCYKEDSCIQLRPERVFLTE
ncbi:MAG: tRNA pseudouridine(55) synthase TruB [Halanaerobiales bacterium]